MVVILVVGVALLGLRYVPLIDDFREVRVSARQLSNQVKTLQPSKLDRSALESLGARISTLDERLVPLRALINDDPLVRLAGSVPVLSIQIEAAGSLVAAADSLVAAGDVGLGLAERVVDLRERNEVDPELDLLPGLVELMATSTQDVDQIAELIEAADRHLSEIPDEAISEIREARDLVAEPLETYLPVLDAYRDLDDVLPELLGRDQDKRYLVLAQNPAELRPTGGYNGTVGVVTIRDGAVVEQRFRDVHELDRQEGLPFVEPPEELADHLLGDDQSWRLADANWSPDFPTSAQKALEFYELESGDMDIDGVIGINTFALDRLLEVVGPVDVPQYDVTVKAGDTTMVLLGETRGGPRAGRKEILDVLARQVMRDMLKLPPERWVSMLGALADIGDEQSVQVWVRDEAAQQAILDVGWGGQLRDDPGDYVHVVESNVAPTSKYNLVIDREDTLVVGIDEEGNALNTLRLDWQNGAGAKGQPYRSLREFSTNEEGWYGAYVRVLTPEGSELIAANGEADEDVRGAERVGTESGRAAFANYLLMPPGDSTLTYYWLAPGVSTQTDAGWEYSLVVEKQPGARPGSLSIRVDLPDGALVLEASEGAVVEGDRVRFETSPISDVELLINYELP